MNSNHFKLSEKEINAIIEKLANEKPKHIDTNSFCLGVYEALKHINNDI